MINIDRCWPKFDRCWPKVAAWAKCCPMLSNTGRRCTKLVRCWPSLQSLVKILPNQIASSVRRICAEFELSEQLLHNRWETARQLRISPDSLGVTCVASEQRFGLFHRTCSATIRRDGRPECQREMSTQGSKFHNSWRKCDANEYRVPDPSGRARDPTSVSALRSWRT